MLSWTAPDKEEQIVDRDLFSGFMEALQMFSEELGTPIRQLQLADMILYIRTYGDFSIRLLVEDKIAKEEVEQIFEELARVTVPLLPQVEMDPDALSNVAIFEQQYRPVLAPLIDHPLEDLAESHPLQVTPASKIALVGLAQAGKTTIKRQFLERWPMDVVKRTAPTLGLNVTRQSLDFLEEKLHVFDFGGQERVRQEHLTKEHAWKNISALIYIVDIQDPSTFTDARSYFNEVWELIKTQNVQLPTLAVFFHKYDPQKRGQLPANVSKCLWQFRDLSANASFHLTSIHDASSHAALIKTLYFALPEVMLKKLLEEGFLHHFKNNLLPCYAKLIETEVEVLPETVRQEVHEGRSGGGGRTVYPSRKLGSRFCSASTNPKPRN